MAALRQSPVTLHPKFISTTTTTASISSSSLRPIPRPLRRRRLPSLKLSLPPTIRRRPARGAAGAVMVDTAASSYATALADVALANGTLEATIADVEKLDKVFSYPSVQEFFANPTISIDKKLEVVGEIAKAEELKPHTANFLCILVDMGRINIVGEIVKEFEACYNKITGTEVSSSFFFRSFGIILNVACLLASFIVEMVLDESWGEDERKLS